MKVYGEVATENEKLLAILLAKIRIQKGLGEVSASSGGVVVEFVSRPSGEHPDQPLIAA